MSSKAETRFKTKFVEKLHEVFGAKCYVQKHHGSEYSAGLPDLYVMANGRSFFFELKVVETLPLKSTSVAFDFTKDPTKLQLHTMLGIQAASDKLVSFLVVWFKEEQRVMFVPAELVKVLRDQNGYLPVGAVQGDTPGIWDWRVLWDGPAVATLGAMAGEWERGGPLMATDEARDFASRVLCKPIC